MRRDGPPVVLRPPAPKEIDPDETFVAPATLLVVWDDLDAAINRVVTALPAQMTAASETLEQERRRMRAALHNAYKDSAGVPRTRV